LVRSTFDICRADAIERHSACGPARDIADALAARGPPCYVRLRTGGGVDIVARLIGQWLSERLGQQFVVENRPGAAANIATEAVVYAPPDGYTLLLVSTTAAINVTFYEKLSFNFIRDIAPRRGRRDLSSPTEAGI
jgi:tripartite-type tricarboxylate transporter receptor subunit TctC